MACRSGVGCLPFVSWFAGMLMALQKGVSSLSSTASHSCCMLLHVPEGQINNCCDPSGMNRHTDLNIWPK